MKIEIKSIFGSILFEYDVENNSIRKTIEKAIASSADLRYANLSSADLRYANLSSADLRYANLSSADLQQIIGRQFAQVSFSGHGECGRSLIAIKEDESVKLFCGCFNGTKEELIAYIEKGEEKYRKSRTLAMETVLQLIEIEHEN